MIDHSKPPDSAVIAPVANFDSLVRAESGLKNCSERELRRCRRFYQIYPQIRETVSPEFGLNLAAELGSAVGSPGGDVTWQRN